MLLFLWIASPQRLLLAAHAPWGCTAVSPRIKLPALSQD